MVKRLRQENTYILSSTKPECPTMNETTLQNVYNVLLSIQEGRYENEITISEDTRIWAHAALNRMFEL